MLLVTRLEYRLQAQGLECSYNREVGQLRWNGLACRSTSQDDSQPCQHYAAGSLQHFGARNLDLVISMYFLCLFSVEILSYLAILLLLTSSSQ